MAIVRVKDVINKEVRQIQKYQTGEIKPVRTNRPHLDGTLTGLLPGDIVVVAGASGAGKTYELQTIRENIMNSEINPSAEKYVFLDYSFEMKLFNLVLRGLSKHLDKPKKEILLQEFDDKEKELAGRYIDTFRDNRFFLEENPCTAEEFYAETKKFLEKHRDKEKVFVAIDHMALFKNGKGGKKDAVDAAGEAINQLKREFDNPIFILLSQLNRGILGRIAENDSNSAPNRSDLYQSDTMFHLADYLVVIQNPHRLGISEYMKVRPDRYPYLEEHFTEPKGSSQKVSFHTIGRIFYHVLKVREEEVVFDDLFIESVEFTNSDRFKEDTIEVMDDDEFLSITFDDEEESLTNF